MNAFDISPAACKEAGNNGCSISQSPEEVVLNSECIITMLPNNDIVLDTYGKMLQTIESNTMFIDSSTIDPNVAKKVCSSIAIINSEFVSNSRFKTPLMQIYFK